MIYSENFGIINVRAEIYFPELTECPYIFYMSIIVRVHFYPIMYIK